MTVGKSLIVRSNIALSASFPFPLYLQTKLSLLVAISILQHESESVGNWLAVFVCVDIGKANPRRDCPVSCLSQATHIWTWTCLATGKLVALCSPSNSCGKQHDTTAVTCNMSCVKFKNQELTLCAASHSEPTEARRLEIFTVCRYFDSHQSTISSPQLLKKSPRSCTAAVLWIYGKC